MRQGHMDFSISQLRPGKPGTGTEVSPGQETSREPSLQRASLLGTGQGQPMGVLVSRSPWRNAHLPEPCLVGSWSTNP